MTWLINRLRVPASESNMAVVLAAAAAVLGLLSVAVVWQAQVIAEQRSVIQWLSQFKLGN